MHFEGKHPDGVSILRELWANLSTKRPPSGNRSGLRGLQRIIQRLFEPAGIRIQHHSPDRSRRHWAILQEVQLRPETLGNRLRQTHLVLIHPNSLVALIDSMKSKTSVSLVQFRLDIDFPNSEIDAVLVEAMTSRMTGMIPPFLMDGKCQIPLDENRMKDTPSEGSVDFCLQMLMGYADAGTLTVRSGRFSDEEKTPLEELGIEVVSFYGLMQGTCHLMCEVSYELFTPELVEKAQKIAQGVFDKYCIFYDKTIPACLITEVEIDPEEPYQLRAFDKEGNVIGEDFEDENQAIMRMWLMGYRPASEDEYNEFKNIPWV